MQSGKRVIYAGFDESQYSSEQFHNSNNYLSEICNTIFSENPSCLKINQFSRNRNHELLNSLYHEDLFSASLTSKGRPKRGDLRNLAFFSIPLVNYFLDRHICKYDSIELHFDGSILCLETRFISSQLRKRIPKVVARGHKKRMKKNPRSKIKYYYQPFLVGLTDCLVNYLFKEHQNGLLLDLSSEDLTKIPIELRNHTFNHHYLWSVS